MTAPEAKPITFYFDFISPYAFLAWTQIHGLAARHGREVRAVPILFAALLNHWGHKGPAEIPPKREYVFKNVLRLAHGLGIRLVPPPSHPFNPLMALRLASLALPEGDQRRLVDLLFQATWGGSTTRGARGVDSFQSLECVIAEAGLEPKALMAAATSDENKARLRAQTNEAIAKGLFGVPTVVADGELFWGLDAFAHIDAFLAGHDPAEPSLVAQWRDLPASAQRAGS